MVVLNCLGPHQVNHIQHLEHSPACGEHWSQLAIVIFNIILEIAWHFAGGQW